MRSYPYSGSSLSNPDAVTQILLRTGNSAPTIAFDNSGLGGNGTPASSLTFSYTTNSNTNGLIIVSVDEATSSPSCTSDKVTGVTNNGTSLTDLGYYAKDTNGLAVKTYYGFAPATSTHNIVVSASASCIRYAAAATYTGVKQSGMPDASGSGNPLSSSGSVSLLQGTTTASYNAWAIVVGVPSTAGAATAGANTTIRQQQSGEIYYADSNGPVYGATGLSWSKGATADWAANFFSLAPLTSNPGTVATTTFTYDNNGNVTAVGTTTFYTYDDANRLTQSDIRVGNSTTTTTYAYGPFGERVSQTAANTTFIYPNKFYSVASSTGTGAKYATTTDYVYAGPNLLATIDQKLVSGSASGTPITRYNHTDNVGSTNVTSDATMNVAQWFDYAPYGSVIATTNTGQTSAGRQYINRFADPSNLDYLNARYYDPARGQFISQDPVFWGKQNIGNPQSLNSYSYALDNPINKEDPDGLAASAAFANFVSAFQSFVKSFSAFVASLSSSGGGGGGAAASQSSSGGGGPGPQSSPAPGSPGTYYVQVLKPSQWIHQADGECFEACVKENGGKRPLRANAIDTAHLNGSDLTTLPDAQAGVSAINEYMLKKQRIPVGVNMQGKPGPNQNAATEHFVNISGYGSDNQGTYYTFHDCVYRKRRPS
jgi:RHS repeat-associated protein